MKTILRHLNFYIKFLFEYSFFETVYTLLEIKGFFNGVPLRMLLTENLQSISDEETKILSSSKCPHSKVLIQKKKKKSSGLKREINAM